MVWALNVSPITPADVDTMTDIVTDHGALTVGISIIFILLLAFFGLFAYLFTRSNKKMEDLVTMLIQAKVCVVDPQMAEIENNLMDFHLSVNSQMKDHLKMLRDIVDADRTFVFTFHNSEKSITGFPYLKASCQIEFSLWNLENNNIMDQRDIQSSALALLCENMSDSGVFLCADIETLRDNDPMFYGWLRKIQSKSFFARVLRDAHGHLIGFVGCDYITDKIGAERTGMIEAEISSIGKSISAILDIQQKMEKKAKKDGSGN